MCGPVNALLQTIIYGFQMVVRIFTTLLLMVENVIIMILQMSYNFISLLMQMCSVIPLCVVFLVTSKMKCFICGGGGACPRGGTCDCLMSMIAVVILFYIFKATGILESIFSRLGYAKALSYSNVNFLPAQDITEFSRNSTDVITEELYYDVNMTNLPTLASIDAIPAVPAVSEVPAAQRAISIVPNITSTPGAVTSLRANNSNGQKPDRMSNFIRQSARSRPPRESGSKEEMSYFDWNSTGRRETAKSTLNNLSNSTHPTTVLYYLV